MPDGIGFTAEDFTYVTDSDSAADMANAKLPALFEKWVKQEGVKVCAWKDQDDWRRPLDETDCDFDWEAYLMLVTEIGK